MNQTTDRDPANPQALIPAILAWVADQSDEADIALEAALLEQGVLSPDDVVESFHVGLGRAHGIRMILGDGSTWVVSTITWNGDPYDVWVQRA